MPVVFMATTSHRRTKCSLPQPTVVMSGLSTAGSARRRAAEAVGRTVGTRRQAKAHGRLQQMAATQETTP